MTVVTLVVALLYLAALGISGVAVLRRLTCRMTVLEKWAYGLPLGNVAWSLVILLLAIVARQLTLPIVIVAAVASVAAALWLWPWGELVAAFAARRARARVPQGEPPSPAEQIARLASKVLSAVGPLSAVVLALFAIRWTILWRGAFTTEADGLWAGHIYIWGDWALHLGDVTAFVYGDNFPPVNSRYLGGPLAYHYLTSITAAALVKLGLEPTSALVLHSWALCLVLLFGLYAFALRLTRDRAAAGLSLVLFLLGGNLAWLQRIAAVEPGQNLWDLFRRLPWDQGAADERNFRWPNMFFSLVEPQRGYIYGLPLFLLILTLLLEGQAQRSRRLFLAAGIVAAMLPFAHTSTLVALALIVPFLFLFLTPAGAPVADGGDAPRPRTLEGRIGGLVRDYWSNLANWFLFGLVWVVLTLPQLYLQQGGERGETRFIRWEIGWVAAPDPWPWFWLKNLGWFIPLLLIALGSRQLLDGSARRLLWAFMPTFVICNLIVFRPWDWDNTKFFLYWFLAVCILVAALLARAWREQQAALARILIAGVVATMIVAGLLVNAQQLLGKDRYLFLTTDEVRLAALVREQTDPHAVFLVATQHNHPVPVLAGRKVLMSYTGWLFAFGIDYAQRERDLEAIYAFTPDAPRLIAQYGLDYIVVGPGERNSYNANSAALRARYGQPVIATEQYEVYKVR
jgi:hypothetical protein